MTPVEGGGFQVRLYEAEGKVTPDARMHLHAKIDQPRETNLLGDILRKSNAASDTIRFNLHPYEIKTFEMKLGQVR